MQIDRVIQVSVEPDLMEEINKITGLDEFATDNWCNLEQFYNYKALPEFINDEQFEALKTGEADYIAFRIDS